MRKLIYTLFFTILFINCKSQQLNKDILGESKLLMSHIFNDFNKKSLDKKNIKNSRFIKNEILYNPSLNEFSSWKALIRKSNLFIPLAINFDIAETRERIDYSKIFTKKEINYMVRQLEEVKPKTWQKYIGLKPAKNEIQKHNSDYHNSTNTASMAYFLTKPVFTSNFKYALIYKENNFGGELVIYQKVNSQWKAVASASVWIS